MSKKRPMQVVGASLLAAATIASGLGFGATAASAAPTSAPRAVGDVSAPFQFLTHPAANAYLYMASDGSVKTAATEVEAKTKATWFVGKSWGSDGFVIQNKDMPTQCLTFSQNYWPDRQGLAQSNIRTGAACTDTPNKGTLWHQDANGNLFLNATARISTVNASPIWLSSLISVDSAAQYGRFFFSNGAPKSSAWVGLPSDLDDSNAAPIANGGFNAQGVASSATIKAGEQQDVAFGMHADAAVTKLTNTTVEAKAPAGTTFTAGQTTLMGKYRASASDAWSDDKTFTVSGSVMANGSLFRGTITDVDGAKIAAGSELQWKVNVAAPADAKDDQQDLDFTASGKTNAGDFTVTGKSPVTITADNSGVNNPFSVDAPIDGSEHKGENTRFSGKGSAGQKITLHVDNFATADVTTTVKQDGTWDVNKYTGTGEYKFTITQTDNGTANGSKSLTINPAAAPINNPFSVDAPMDGSDHKGEDTVFSGKGSAGQQVTVHVDNFPSVDVTTTVKNDGTWSVVKHTGVGEYKLTVTQKDGATANGSKSLTVNPSAAPINNPFSVDAPIDGSDHKGEDTTFSGKGSAGQQVTIHVDNFQSVDVTTTVKNNGTWSVNKHTGTGEYKITVTQKDGATANGSKSLTINPANAPVVLPFDVTSPKTNTTGYKGEWVEFTGTGTPGRTVTLKVTNFTSVSPSVVVQNDGHWSLKRRSVPVTTTSRSTRPTATA
ncbi:hypothetical protein ACLBWP_09265 [Microbacterium sp. M1A1_1b]